jgi:hypothetical protein
MIDDERQSSLVIELVCTRGVLGIVSIAYFRGSAGIGMFVVRFSQHMPVTSKTSPRQVWDWISVMIHTPMIEAQPAIPFGELNVSNARLTHGVNVFWSDASVVEVNRAMRCLRSSQRMTSNYEFPNWQFGHSHVHTVGNAPICVLESWVAVATAATEF